MKRIMAVAVLLIIVLTACGPVAQPTTASAPTSPPSTAALQATTAPAARTLHVFAAASLTQAFEEIGKAFGAANPGVTVAFNFAGSQTLQSQIEQGAPVDVIASASGANMDALATGGFVDKAASQVFLTNRLVVILPPSNPANVQSLRDLSKSAVKIILADACARRKILRQILDNLSKDPAYGADFGTKALANVVSNETMSSRWLGKSSWARAMQESLTSRMPVAADLKIIEIPDAVNVIAKYPIAPLLRSADPDLAALFVEYVLSEGGQATLKKWGFTPIQ
jgi:molybdate transport system substrate-binding protein